MKPPRNFTVAGPFDVPVKGSAGSRWFDRNGLTDFWFDCDLGDELGCYVFALRRSRGYLPIYVGKTTRSFRVECFNDHNYRKLHQALDGQVGTLVLFLVHYEKTRGNTNAKVVGSLERYLVEVALEKNPELVNKVFTATDPGFAIRGVHRSRGRSSAAALEFKKAMGLA